MSYKRRVFVVCLLIAAVSMVFWNISSNSKTVRNVLLITIDTCRADHLSCYGFDKNTTPNIDALAKKGVRFENAVSPNALTLPAHSSIFTGTYPPYHGVHANIDYKLSRSNTTIAEIMRDNGYATGAIISSSVIGSKFGVNQGFGTFNETFVEEIGGHNDVERRGAEASKYASDFLEQHADDPFFLFLHYYDPHTEYAPPEPFASEYQDDPYSGEIAYTDHCIGQVIEKLKNLGLYDSTLIIVVGDHGESLGEHGETEHGYFVYQSTNQIPFIIRNPEYHKAKVIRDIVSLVDVMPTILSCLDIPVPEHVQGKDLSGYLKRKHPVDPERKVYAESLLGTRFGCNPILGIVGWEYKYIQTSRSELYNLTKDPIEQNNLIDKQAKRSRLMQGQLQELMLSIIGNASIDSKSEIDEKTMAKLESLGYVGGGDLADSLEFDLSKKDPKDLVGYHELTQKVLYLQLREKFTEAKNVCNKMLEQWPEISFTHSMLTRLAFTEGDMQAVIQHGRDYVGAISDSVDLTIEASGLSSSKLVAAAHRSIGQAGYELERYDLAVKHFTQALKIKQNWPGLWNELGGAYFQKKDYDNAIYYWTQALKLNPSWAEVHNYLATAFYQKRDYDSAYDHWAQALKLKPDWGEIKNKLIKLDRQIKRDAVVLKYQQDLRYAPEEYTTRDKLAKILYTRGKTQEAIEHWYQVLQLKPDWSEVQNSLATALYKQGKEDEAIEHWSIAIEQKPDWPEVYTNLAWVFATTKNAELRNSQQAIEFAEKACQLTENSDAGMLYTLSVAYAADNRFEEAAATAQTAIDLAKSKNQEKLASQISDHLKLYRANKQYQD